MTYSEKCFKFPTVLGLFRFADGAWYRLYYQAGKVEPCTKQGCYFTACGVTGDLGQFALFDPLPPYGDVLGHVTADCPGPQTPLLGVTVDAYEVGRPDLVASSVTDESGY